MDFREYLLNQDKKFLVELLLLTLDEHIEWGNTGSIDFIYERYIKDYLNKQQGNEDDENQEFSYP